MIHCANCRKPADLRAGWVANGHWTEADFCNPCMEKTWSMFKSTPCMTTATFGEVGVPIHIRTQKQSAAADRDDMAALRDYL